MVNQGWVLRENRKLRCPGVGPNEPHSSGRSTGETAEFQGLLGEPLTERPEAGWHYQQPPDVGLRRIASVVGA